MNATIIYVFVSYQGAVDANGQHEHGLCDAQLHQSLFEVAFITCKSRKFTSDQTSTHFAKEHFKVRLALKCAQE